MAKIPKDLYPVGKSAPIIVNETDSYARKQSITKKGLAIVCLIFAVCASIVLSSVFSNSAFSYLIFNNTEPLILAVTIGLAVWSKSCFRIKTTLVLLAASYLLNIFSVMFFVDYQKYESIFNIISLILKYIVFITASSAVMWYVTRLYKLKNDESN